MLAVACIDLHCHVPMMLADACVKPGAIYQGEQSMQCVWLSGSPQCLTKLSQCLTPGCNLLAVFRENPDGMCLNQDDCVDSNADNSGQLCCHQSHPLRQPWQLACHIRRDGLLSGRSQQLEFVQLMLQGTIQLAALRVGQPWHSSDTQAAVSSQPYETQESSRRPPTLHLEAVKILSDLHCVGHTAGQLANESRPAWQAKDASMISSCITEKCTAGQAILGSCCSWQARHRTNNT